MLGLPCCVQALSSCGEQGLLFVAVRRLLIAVASLVVEHRLQAHGFSSCGSQAPEHRLSSCGTQAQLLHSMWDLPGPGLEPPALSGGFLTTVPPGKPYVFFNCLSSSIRMSAPRKKIFWSVCSLFWIHSY